MVARELKRVVGDVALVPIPKPWPGPEEAPLLDANVLRDVDFVRIAAGNPNPQPSIVPLQDQLTAATEFRAALEKAMKSVDGEIKRLQTQDASGNP
jgi:hypothetical protein